MNAFKSTVALMATLLSAGAVPTVALAQSSKVDVVISNVLEEVVVTARRREESLQRTPVAVTVFSAQALEALSISDIRDIAGYTPNVEFTPGNITGNAGGHIFIRGIGQYDFLTTYRSRCWSIPRRRLPGAHPGRPFGSAGFRAY